VIEPYLNNEAGMKALAEYLARPGEHLIAGPEPLPRNESQRFLNGGPDLAKLAEKNCSCVRSDDKQYAHTRLLALSIRGDKALVEIYINRGALMEEWYHIVLRRSDNEWRLASVYKAAES